MKRVVWEKAKIGTKSASGEHRSVTDFLSKSGPSGDRDDIAELMQAARGPMLALTDIRLRKGLPFKVMRPLTYMTSIMNTETEENDGFYAVQKSTSLGKFIDVQVTIPVGSELLLKSLDVGLQEFVFTDTGSGVEHAIPFDSRDLLLSQTDVVETVRDFIEKSQTS